MRKTLDMNETERAAIEHVKTNTKADIEKDAANRSFLRLRAVQNKRGGKFKLSEKEFRDELAAAQISGEFSAAERLLRLIEVDPELDSKDLIRGEIHNFIMLLHKILIQRGITGIPLNLEDMLWGKYTTEKVLVRQIQAMGERQDTAVL